MPKEGKKPEASPKLIIICTSFHFEINQKFWHKNKFWNKANILDINDFYQIKHHLKQIMPHFHFGFNIFI